MPVHAVLPRSGKKDGKEPGIEGTVMMEEKKAQKVTIRNRSTKQKKKAIL